MKICVYAIAKNEEKFVERWVSSMREADGIYVLDTGSTDQTVEKLADLGVTVHQEVIEPWRFDTARNRSLELVPADADVCVCTDLDEVFQPGWREALEKSWTDGTEQLRYLYIWNVKSDGTPGTSFRYEKAHARHGFRWAHPVHEVLERTDGKRIWKVSECEMVLEHHIHSPAMRESLSCQLTSGRLASVLAMRHPGKCWGAEQGAASSLLQSPPAAQTPCLTFQGPSFSLIYLNDKCARAETVSHLTSAPA